MAYSRRDDDSTRNFWLCADVNRNDRHANWFCVSQVKKSLDQIQTSERDFFFETMFIGFFSHCLKS